MHSYKQTFLVCLLLLAGFHWGYSQTISSISSELEQMRNSQNAFLDIQLNERITKIISTPDFIRSANVSLNALVLSNSLTDYLNDVNTLNNPTNGDLGFSLSERVNGLLQEHIFNSKKTKKEMPRFMRIAKGVIQNPLIRSFASAVPIVNSLGSVMNMVRTTALNNKAIEIEDIEAFQEEVTRYISHYQALADATSQFQGTMLAVNERTTELKLILESFTRQRMENILPLKVEPAEQEENLRHVLIHHYEKDRVLEAVNGVLANYVVDGVLNREMALMDPQLVYPVYAVSEARFLLDELEAISNEYLITLNIYQRDIENVLEKAIELGDQEMIERKIKNLREKLNEVEEAFSNAVHVEEVEYRFQALAKPHINIGLQIKHHSTILEGH